MKVNASANSGIRQPSFSFVPQGVAKFFFYAACVLQIINLVGLVLQKILGYDNFFLRALVVFFDVSEENNIPALFSTLILFTASLLLFINYLIYRLKSLAYKIHWLLLSGIFLFLAVDEALGIHEQFNRIRSLLQSNYSGYLDYPWILPYGIFAILVGLFFYKFLFHLPSRIRILFVISGIGYVVSTIGFEPIEGHLIEIYGDGYEYYLFCSLEEFLEMSSIILFNYTLLSYAASFSPSLKITSKISRPTASTSSSQPTVRIKVANKPEEPVESW
ncbi:hypothetical protein [Terrimonas pollutisoli]|uniref:hypothetical protein n=1 Tax=Terrimonas pollutisoli TaxID=3034147 RepID=UPI0023ECCE95|nr:hypothetical protein [Terrimonas sp. H1YJ31]